MITDLDICERAIADRDESAFAIWVAAVEHRLRVGLAGFARTVDTESVIQETLLRVWQVAPRFKPDGKPEGLLRLAHRIARNLAITEIRRRHPRGGLPPDLEDDTETAPSFEDDDALREGINHCFKRLPEAPRMALEARLRSAAVRDESLADSLVMKPNTFFQNIRRARLALLKCLKSRGISLGIEP